MLHYKNMEVGEYFPNNGQILLKMDPANGYSLLLERLLDDEGGGGYSMQKTRREELYTTFMSGSKSVSGLEWRFPIDENNDEGFMLSTNENTIILPRIFQRKSASVSPNISAVETLRNFDHREEHAEQPTLFTRHSIYSVSNPTSKRRGCAPSLLPTFRVSKILRTLQRRLRPENSRRTNKISQTFVTTLLTHKKAGTMLGVIAKEQPTKVIVTNWPRL